MADPELVEKLKLRMRDPNLSPEHREKISAWLTKAGVETEELQPRLDEPGGVGPELMRKVVGPAQSAAENMIDVMTLGVGRAIDPTRSAQLQSMQQRDPAASALGIGAGMFSPQGAPTLLGRGASAAVRALPGAAPAVGAAAKLAARPTSSGLLRGMATTALESGVAGGAHEAGVQAVKGIEGTSEGIAPATESVLKAAGLSALLGGGMEAVGRGAGSLYHSLRELPRNMPWLSKIEEAGGGTRVFSPSGLKAPRGYDDALAAARARGRDTAHEAVAEDLAPIAQRILARREPRIKRAMKATNERYYNSPEGLEGATVDEMFEEMLNHIHSREGRSMAQETGFLKEHARRLLHMEIVPHGTSATGQGMKKLPGGMRTARETFGEEATQLSMPSGSNQLATRDKLALPGEIDASKDALWDVYIRPKRVGAKELDKIIKDIATRRKKSPDDDALAGIQRAAFKVRDKFKPNEFAPMPKDPVRLPDGTEIGPWSALKHKHAQKLDELGMTKEALGISRTDPVKFSKDAVKQTDTITKALMRLGEKGHGRMDDAIEKLLVNNPVGAAVFKKLFAVKGHEKLRGLVQPSVSMGYNPTAGRGYGFLNRLGESMRMRVDPVMASTFTGFASPRPAQVGAAAEPLIQIAPEAADSLMRTLSMMFEQEEETP